LNNDYHVNQQVEAGLNFLLWHVNQEGYHSMCDIKKKVIIQYFICFSYVQNNN